MGNNQQSAAAGKQRRPSGEGAAFINGQLSQAVREEWYPSPGVIDCTATESNLEWRELMELHAIGTQIDPARLKAALLHGIPPALRPQAWLAFSGCTEWMRRHPKVYEQLCTRIEQGGFGGARRGVGRGGGAEGQGRARLA